jgi:transmembrane sensor
MRMETPDAQAPRNSRRLARAEAAAWIVRLHGPHRSPELEAGFRDWLAADPENGRQFERVTEVWDAGSTIPVVGVPRMTRWQGIQSSQRWALAAMLLLVLGLGAWGLNDIWLNPVYATRLGEQRLVRLDDGSRIALNSDTRIRVSCCDPERRVRLERGEAYFEVARDIARPFVVTAGDRQVTALGTAFVVRHEATRTTVTLVEGKVAVSGPGSADGEGPSATSGNAVRDSSAREEQGVGATDLGAAVVLSPGQRLTFSGQRAKPQLDEPRIEVVTAWRRGEVMLDRTTLADAVAEMNRYDERMLVIDDPGVAVLRISGIYHAGDSAGFAQTVAKLYGLHVVQQSGRIHLSHGTPKEKFVGPPERSID